MWVGFIVVGCWGIGVGLWLTSGSFRIGAWRKEREILDRDTGWEGREEYARRAEFTRQWLERAPSTEDR